MTCRRKIARPPRDYDISDGKPGNARDLDDYPSSHEALPVETYKLLWRVSFAFGV